MPDFDPTELLETTLEGDSFNSHFTPFPETECYGRIKKVAGRRVMTKDNRESLLAEFTFTTDDQHVLDETGLKEPQVRYSIWLDADPMTGRLLTKDENPNANVRLARLKKACGLKEGKKFRIADFDGLGCYIKTKHRAPTGDSDDIQTDVVAVSAEPFRSRS